MAEQELKEDGLQQDSQEEIPDESSVEEKAEARRLGHVPLDKFKGDPERWVDAKEFLRRGKEILPLVKKHNKDLEETVATQAGQIRALTASLKAIEDNLEQDLKDDVEATVGQLEADIAAAFEAEDSAKAAKLTKDLVTLLTKANEAGKERKPAPAAAGEVPLTPEYRAWTARNSDWWEVDKAKTRRAMAFAQVAAAEGFRGSDFYEEVDQQLAKYYREGEETPKESRVAGGRPSSGGDDPEPKTKGFSQLPKDAKEACTRLERKMVGEGKPHKTPESWRKSYANQYWSMP